MERKDERYDCKSDKRSEDRFSPPARRQISDRRRAVVMLETPACEYASNVVPAYYEIALKTKAARDEESQGMLDITSSTTELSTSATQHSAVSSETVQCVSSSTQRRTHSHPAQSLLKR